MAPGVAAVTENCGDASTLEAEKEAIAPSTAATSKLRFIGCNRRKRLYVANVNIAQKGAVKPLIIYLNISPFKKTRNFRPGFFSSIL